MATKKDSSTTKTAKTGTKTSTAKATTKSADDKTTAKTSAVAKAVETESNAKSQTVTKTQTVAANKKSTNGDERSNKGAKLTPYVSFEQIATRAYHIWLERGCTHGNDIQDWLKAEAELLKN